MENKDKTLEVSENTEFELAAGCRAETPKHVIFRGQNFMATAGVVRQSPILNPSDFLDGLDFNFDKNSTSELNIILEEYAKLKPIKTISLRKLKQITDENSLTHYTFKFRYEIFTSVILLFSILFM